MKLSSILTGMAAATVISACSANAQQNYTVTVPMGPSVNNTMAYLYDWDANEAVDSAIVTDATAVFKGHVEDPFMGRIFVNGQRGPFLVVEKGDISVSAQGEPSGTTLNDRFVKEMGRFDELKKEYDTLNLSDSVQNARAQAIVAEYEALPETLFKENIDNPLGLFWFMQAAYEMPVDQLKAQMAQYPRIGNSRVAKETLAALEKRETSGTGHHYIDFTVSYDGKEQKFSDYVKPGEYTLVDFWASWCGPCMRQAKVIKELYNRYKGKGLNVVGVAVWDEPDNTLAAIKSHGLEWPNIINAQTIPTDLYGINAIPCILLINPDGIIVSRDKQGEELIEDVEKAMAGFNASAQAETGSEEPETAQPAPEAPAF